MGIQPVVKAIASFLLLCDWLPPFWLQAFFHSSLPLAPLNHLLCVFPSFPFSHQSFQGMLSSLHSELDIQRYLMKIRLPHRVSQPFLYLICIILICVWSHLHALRQLRVRCTLFTLSDLTRVSRRTGLYSGTSPNCQKTLIEVLKFLVRLHTQECEEQSLHGGVFGKKRAYCSQAFRL